jgi:hypothetical protein
MNITFPDSIQGLDFIEYLSIFIGLIFALAVAEFFLSLGKMMRAGKRVRYDLEYVLWIVLMLCLFIVSWYIYWQRLEYITHGLGDYVLSVLPNLVIFAIVAIYFPEITGKEVIDLTKHFAEIRVKFFGLWSLYIGINLVVDSVHWTQGSEFGLITQSFYLLMGITAVLFDRKWIRYTVFCLFGLQLVFLFIHLS